jgi:hypothetical protein
VPGVKVLMATVGEVLSVYVTVVVDAARGSGCVPEIYLPIRIAKSRE